MPDNGNNQNSVTPAVRTGVMRKMAERINANSDKLYRSTYYSDPENKHELEDLKHDVDTTIKNIMDTNASNIGEPSVSKLYERMYMNAQKDGSTITEFERIFGDNEFVNNLANSYMDNRWVKAVDTEIDEVLKYMPKLQEALYTIRDNVLSADSLNKDYLNLESDLPTKETEQQFARNIEDMKEKYDLLRLTSDTYENISKYGEEFIYCVPYTLAIQRLMDRRNQMRNIAVKANYGESGQVTITEGADQTVLDAKFSSKEIKENGLKDFNINLTIENGFISSIIEAQKQARDRLKEVHEQSLSEQYLREQVDNKSGSVVTEDVNQQIMPEYLNEEISIGTTNSGYAYNSTFDNDAHLNTKLPTHHHFDQTLGDKLILPDGMNDDAPATDGLKATNPREKIKDMNGCIVKRLKRERVTPIILNDICLGYYYFELDENMELFEGRFSTTGMVNTITGLRSNGRSEAFDAMQRREELLRNIASNLADKIDAKFIDNNQDLKKEIYHILKYNDSFNASLANGETNNIRVSYIPPEDMFHLYFDLDEDTKRGISDLQLSLVPAKLWVAIYITNCLAIMTRGNDKRVYYVRQSVETNIAKTLLKTINEIKKANFGIRQIENINSVLNITGRFNDYIIPRGADGNSPIEFEVMQGQSVEIKTDLLNLLEESAINPTGVPIEIINSRQSPDYATQLTMSNSKFVRSVYSRQTQFQRIMGALFTRIYNVEYGNRDKIRLMLPPPLFLNVNATNQVIVNTNDYCNNIAEIIMADEANDAVKAKFAKELKIYHLGSYINMDVINQIINKARQSLSVDIVSNPENLEGGEE